MDCMANLTEKESGGFEPPQEANISDPIVGNPQATFIVLCCLLSAIVNVRVAWVVLGVPRRRLRQVSILVAHLSFVTISFSSLAAMFIAEKWNLVTFIWPGNCQLFSFLRHTVYVVYPLSMASVIQEMTGTVPTKLGQSLILKLSGMWVFGGLTNIQTIFMFGNEQISWKCNPIPFHEGLDRSPMLVYELFRFTFFHVVVSGYMIYAMHRIHSRMIYLNAPRPVPNEWFRKKVQMVRYMYSHSILFIAMWIPSGFFRAMSNTFIWSGFNRMTVIKTVSNVLLLTALPFFLMSPLIYLCFIENVTVRFFCLERNVSRYGYGGRGIRCPELDRVGVDGRPTFLEDPFQGISISGVATMARTLAWERCSPNSGTFNGSAPMPSYWASSGSDKDPQSIGMEGDSNRFQGTSI